MKIEEVDLFTYVFFPNNIPAEKHITIENERSYIEIIDFYKELKNNTVSELSHGIKIKLSQKIPEYTFFNSVKLKKITLPDNIISEIDKLAAKSPLNSKISNNTFIDESNFYFIKVYAEPNFTKIYIFSETSDTVNNFELKISPSNEIIRCVDNSNPIILNKNIEIDSIELIFSK
ncbi:MAG: hypothetical protein IPM32_14285 [Ignavibacteriae bacterium]|nr:hypothetical protein [Ignavibacteriota bacterium]